MEFYSPLFPNLTLSFNDLSEIVKYRACAAISLNCIVVCVVRPLAAATHPRPPGEAAARGSQAEVSLLQHAGQLKPLFSSLQLAGLRERVRPVDKNELFLPF